MKKRISSKRGKKGRLGSERECSYLKQLISEEDVLTRLRALQSGKCHSLGFTRRQVETKEGFPAATGKQEESGSWSSQLEKAEVGWGDGHAKCREGWAGSQGSKASEEATANPFPGTVLSKSLRGDFGLYPLVAPTLKAATHRLC